MSSRQTNNPAQEPEDDGTTSAASSSVNEEESEAEIQEQIRLLVTRILERNNGDLRAMDWDLVAQAASPALGFTVTGAQCERRFSRIVDRVYPPDQQVTNPQATASTGINPSSTITNSAPGVANGGQAAQGSAVAGPSSQNTTYGSGHTVSAAVLRATSSNVPNTQTTTGEEDEWETEPEEST